jgi:hypothetical protein
VRSRREPERLDPLRDHPADDVGPKLERAFGDDEIETYLEIDAADLPALSAALGEATADPMTLLAERYRDDTMATTHLRELLAEHKVPHRFNLV